MEKAALQAQLEALHHQLSQVDEVDVETRQLLNQVVSDIRRIADQPSEASQENIDQSRDRLQSALTQFEAEHPQLAQVMQRMIDGLANLGI